MPREPETPTTREAERLRLIGGMRRSRAEIAQLIRDLNYWNTHFRPAGADPIDPDPDGELARQDEWLADQIGRLEVGR